MSNLLPDSDSADQKIKEYLCNYPVVIETPVAWGEMDAFGHVNNIFYLRYFESARIAYFSALELPHFLNGTGIGPIMAQVQCKFRAPLKYPDTISVGVRILELGDDRFKMHYRIVSHKLQIIAAEGEDSIVTFDYRTGEKALIPRELVAAIHQIEANRLV